MKINQSVEQGIYVVLMLALEKEHNPVKSAVLSEILGVSDSYLKKILHKMAAAGVIKSNASKNGGFQLAKSVEEISVYDVYSALEGTDCGLKLSGMAHHIFVDDEKLTHNEKTVKELFDNAFEAFADELKKMKLSELLIKENYENGWTHWSDKLKNMSQSSEF